MKTIFYFLITALSFVFNWNVYSQQPYMVKDINLGTNTSFSYDPSFTKINSTLFFAANDGVNGFELWKSDGTNASTVMVKDIYPGYQFASVPNNSDPFNLTNVNGTLFFTANNGINGSELWKSDGTEAGTVMVKDINIYPNFSDGNSDAAMFTAVNGVLYFRCNNIDNGYELWKSDGTATGTVMVKDIYTGNNSYGTPNSSVPYSLTNVNGVLFFGAVDEINGIELWKSDGTSAGTIIVGGQPGLQSSIGSYPFLTDVNGTLFFVGEDTTNGRELWKSDGTASGTMMVKDIFPGNNGFTANNSTPWSLVNINGTLFFSASDSEVNSNNQNSELWKSDGTSAGTVKVKEIRTGTYNYGSFPNNLTNANGTLYFSANDGINGIELWKSDGTEAGTTMIKDLYAGVGGSEPGQFTNINGTVYFVANDAIIGQELFKTDGTASGTIGYNIRFLSESSSPEGLINVADNLFFNATNGGQNGRELWRLELNPLSITENTSNETKIKIFPNPVKDILTIQNSENLTIDKISITDLTGKKVLEQNTNSNTINVEKLQNGIYVVQIISDGKSSLNKFIKN
ncbi:ELWxxDGT repeat protein [Flavobacterium sp.]|uniref:ELWxxDGT repeat protein n=1 Tax=Flavobacterium sp. TaxID=239 RepID=UPI00286E0D56|nr:ELWxxDGT repeat protein [Flavobacterium sp.]